MNRSNPIVDRQKIFDAGHWLLAASVLVALGFCLVLARQKADLADRVGQAEARYLDGACLRVGDVVPRYAATHWLGAPANVLGPAAEGPRLLQIVSLHCAARHRQMVEWWPQLSSDPRLATARPALIAIEPAAAARQRLPAEAAVGEILTAPELSFRRAYRVAQVPLLALIEPGGEAVWVHRGALDDDAYGALVDLVGQFAQIDAKP